MHEAYDLLLTCSAGPQSTLDNKSSVWMNHYKDEFNRFFKELSANKDTIQLKDIQKILKKAGYTIKWSELLKLRSHHLAFLKN